MSDNNRKKMLGAIVLFLVAAACLLSSTHCRIEKRESTDAYCETAVDMEKRADVIEGVIVDSYGEVITQAEDYGISGQCVQKHFGCLVGFNDPECGSFGLRGKFSDYLYTPDNSGHGAKIVLTVDSALQNYIGDQMAGINGSVIAMERDSGRILALVSSNDDFPDVNRIPEMTKEIFDSAVLPITAYGYADSETPGSVFKIITACAIIENNMENQKYTDMGIAEIGAFSIRNAHHKVYGDVSLRDAFAHSVNTYFAAMSAELGCDVIERKSRAFLLGEDIELDFTTLTSVVDMKADIPEMAAITGYGQGYTQVTPLHMAIIASAVANGGEMIEPYLVDSIVRGEKTIYTGRSEVLARPISAETAEMVKDIMHYTAVESYGIDSEKYGMICAKTGTAELTNGLNHAYLVTFNDEYIVVASRNDTMEYGISLKDIVLSVYDRLMSKGGE